MIFKKKIVKLNYWTIFLKKKKAREKHMFSGSGNILETGGSDIGGKGKKEREEVTFL